MTRVHVPTDRETGACRGFVTLLFFLSCVVNDNDDDDKDDH